MSASFSTERPFMALFQSTSHILLPSLCAVAVLTAVPVHAQYAFQTINDPSATSIASPNDGTGTDTTGINNAGRSVGFYVDATGYHGFVDNNGSFEDVNVPGATTTSYGAATFAYGIDNNGLIVGRYDGPNGPGDEHGFLYSSSNGGAFTAIIDPNAVYGTVAYSVNDTGQVAGYYQDGVGIHGYSYNEGTGTFTSVLRPSGAEFSYADGINNAGDIVGAYTIGDGTGYHGFIFNGNSYLTVDDPGATHGTYLQGINNAGQVVGYYDDVTGNHSFVYADGTFTAVNDPNATAGFGTYVEGINDGGTVVGSFRDAHGDHGFSATPAAVPEVSTVVSLGLILALGMGSMMLACKKSA